jgi:hypothetical protein
LNSPATPARRHVRRPTVAERRVAALLAVLTLAVSLACGEPFVRTNPYDPEVAVTITIVGPDTLFSYREEGLYSAHSDPALPDTAFQFSSGDSVILLLAGGNTFISIAPPLYPATLTETVIAGVGAIDTEPQMAPPNGGFVKHVVKYRHIAYKSVVLTQRVTNIQLRCPDTHACDSLPVGGVWSAWVDGRDADNHQIVALTSAAANPATGTPVATFALRDSTVASVTPVGIRAASVTAKKVGSTWIVATRGALLDSLQVTVR